MLLVLFAGPGSSQPVYFRHYQVEDGLANNTVFSVFQDSRGFMWFGTKEGLNRFDGSVFKTFGIIQEQQPGIKEFVYSIDEGIHNTLWVGTRLGLYEFDPRTETFTQLPTSLGNEILNVYADGKGNIWFTANLKLFRYNESDKTTRHYNLKAPNELKISAICSTNDRTVLVGSVNRKLFRYDSLKDSFLCITPQVPADQKNGGGLNKILCTSSGEILIGTTSGLQLFNPVNNNYYPLTGYPLQNKPIYVRDILFFSEDEYWVASETGIYSVNLRTRQLKTLRLEDSNPYSLSDNAVYALFKDNEGGIWCGTYFGGVNYYHSRHSYFQKYFHRNDNEKSLSGNAIRELCADEKGNLWIGTEDAGLNKLNVQTGDITRFPSPGVTASTNIHSLLIDRNELWVGTFQQGLDVIDINTGKRLRHYNAEPATNGLRSNFIISSCKTRSGDMLFGTSQGIQRYQRESGKFVLAPGFPEYVYVFSLYESREGIIWAGTIGTGLYFFNPKTGETGNFRYDASDSTSLSSNSVCGIFEDSQQNLWISTEGGGLCLLKKTDSSFKRFNTGSGLPSNMIYKVLEDKNGKLWVSTSNGLAWYDPVPDTWKIFTKAHGLLTSQFNYSSGYSGADGKLFFGSVKGLVSFNPNLVMPGESSPNVYITSFQVNNQELVINGTDLKRSISFTDSISLTYDQSSFSIGFAALTYIANDMTKYVYRLDGLDKSWTYLPANRKVYFTGLPPGKYTFRTRTVGEDEKEQNKETRLFIHILPPWWLSPVAYFAYVIGTLVLIYALVSAYHRRQKERHLRKLALFNVEKEKEIYKAKIEFFTNVAHEIRTPLTLIKGPLEMVIDKVGEQPAIKKSLRSIERNTERLLTLTDQLLDFRKTENQGFSLSFVKVDVVRLVKEDFLAFSEAAQKKSLKFEIELPENNFAAFIDIEAFHKIIANLVGNAVKYADSNVLLKVSTPAEEQGSFCIEVYNDGPLIPWHLREKIFEPFFRINTMEEPGSGIGLPLARALTQLHNGSLELKQAEDQLNIFVLTLPIHQKVEFKLNTLQKKAT